MHMRVDDEYVPLPEPKEHDYDQDPCRKLSQKEADLLRAIKDVRADMMRLWDKLSVNEASDLLRIAVKLKSAIDDFVEE